MITGLLRLFGRGWIAFGFGGGGAASPVVVYIPAPGLWAQPVDDLRLTASPIDDLRIGVQPIDDLRLTVSSKPP